MGMQGDFKRKAVLVKKQEEAGKQGEKQNEAMEFDAWSIEPKAVKDVTDVGNGRPLFAQFAYEDWTLLGIRYELHLLLHAFRKDLNDPDRPSFSEQHLPFYYNRYFKKPFNLKAYSVERFANFAEFVKDTIVVDETNNSFLKPVFAADEPMASFVKLAEEARRERQMFVDAGDEAARLKFARSAPPPQRQHQDEKGGKGFKRQYQPGPSSHQDSSKQPRQAYQSDRGRS